MATDDDLVDAVDLEDPQAVQLALLQRELTSVQKQRDELDAELSRTRVVLAATQAALNALKKASEG